MGLTEANLQAGSEWCNTHVLISQWKNQLGDEGLFRVATGGWDECRWVWGAGVWVGGAGEGHRHGSSRFGLPIPDRLSHLPRPLSPKRTDLVHVLTGAVPPDAQGSPSPNSSMTTAELQEYWRKEKRCWRRVKLLFEVASARIEERNVCKFVVS